MLLRTLLQSQPSTQTPSSRPAELPELGCGPTVNPGEERGKDTRLAKEANTKSFQKQTKVIFIFFQKKKKEYPIFHVNIDNLLNKISSFVIFLFFSAHAGVVPKYLKYVRYWKNKPAWSRDTDVFCV